MKHQSQRALKERYGASEPGNFAVIDTIGVPHPYCIGPKHVVHAADHFSGILSKECIEDAERKKVARCDICKGKLPYAEHKLALLISCNADLTKEDGEANDELRAYLLASKDKAIEDGYEGFAFKDDRKEHA